MLRNKRDYRTTKNPEVLKELQNKKKNENQLETCQMEPLKKKDLLRYFKKVQKELRREISSDNQDNNSSIVSENSKTAMKKILKNKEKPLNSKTNCFDAFKSSLLGRVKEKTKNVASFKSKHDISDIYNDDPSCDSYRKSTSDSTHLDAKKVTKNYMKSSNHVTKVPIKNQCCQHCQLSSKLHKTYSIKDTAKWRDTQKVRKREINKNQSKESFQSGRTNDIRISSKKKSQRQISKSPVDTYSSSTKISLDSKSSSKAAKKNTAKLCHKYTQSIKSTSNKKITENQEIRNISSAQFLRNSTPFPIKNDLNRSEILHCKQLLKQEKNNYHPPNYSFCNEELNLTNIQCQCNTKSKDILPSPKSQKHLSSRDLEKSPQYLRNRVNRPKEFFVSQSTECDSENQILQLEKEVLHRAEKYRGRSWLDNGNTNILGNGGDVSYKNKAGRLCEKRGQEKLCKLVNTWQGREWLGCSCEGEEEEETADCFEYCRCPENVDNYDRSKFRLQCQGSCKTASMGQTKNIDSVAVKNTYVQPLQKCCYTKRQKILEKNRDRESPEVSFRERDEGFVCKKPESQTNRKIVMASPLRKKNNDGKGQTYPQTFHRTVRLGKNKGFTQFDRESFSITKKPVFLNSNTSQVQKQLTKHGKPLNNVTNRCEMSCQTGRMSKSPRELNKKIINNDNPEKEFSFVAKASSTPIKSNQNFQAHSGVKKSPRCKCKELFLNSTPSCQMEHCSCIETEKNEKSNSTIPKRDLFSSTTHHSALYNPDRSTVTKPSFNLQKTQRIDSPDFTSFSRRTNCRNCSYCHGDYEFDSEVNTEKLWDPEVSVRRKWPTDPTNVRVVKPRDSYGKTNLKKILIYPPHGEPGPPLTLYKNASRVNCKVKGNVCKGFSYNVTYIQKFVSPAWHPEKDADSFFLGIPEKCDCSSGYG